METAMCLIEANQPVSLPDIVCQMRDQRAMLIQTAVTSHCCVANVYSLTAVFSRWFFLYSFRGIVPIVLYKMVRENVPVYVFVPVYVL